MWRWCREMTTKLRYCPACAGELEVRPVGTPASPHPICRACGFVLWQNPKPSVQALIVRGEGTGSELLLGRQSGGEGRGRWDAPGGFLNLGDEPRAALVRECEREFGIVVRVCEPLGAFPDSFAGGEIAIYYRCELQSGDPRPADLVDTVEWFPVGGTPELAFESTKAAVEALRKLLEVD